MKRWRTGLTVMCLTLLLTGCGLLPTRTVTVPVLVTPQVPDHLTAPLPAPAGLVVKNRDILALLADYEALRRRANADRAAVLEILDTDAINPRGE